jgi:putative ABC transport system permease protein
VFSLVWAVLLKPLPYAAPEAWSPRLEPLGRQPARAAVRPEYLDYAERTRLAGDRGAGLGSVNLGASARPSACRRSRSPPTCSTCSARRPRWAAASAREERAGTGASPVSDALWRRRFARDPGVVGRTVSVDGEPFEVVGVLPRGFRLPIEFRLASAAEIVMPLALDRARLARGAAGTSCRRSRAWPRRRARRRRRAETAALVAGSGARLPGRARPGELRDRGRAAARRPARPLAAGAAGAGGAVALVLLLTCANVAGLLLARSKGRRQELAVRAALGADRFRLVRQLLTEAARPSLAGAALGLAVAAASCARWSRWRPRRSRASRRALDGPVLASRRRRPLGRARLRRAAGAADQPRGRGAVLGETVRGGAAGARAARRAGRVAGRDRGGAAGGCGPAAEELRAPAVDAGRVRPERTSACG